MKDLTQDELLYWMRRYGWIRPTAWGETLYYVRGTTDIEMEQYRAYADSLRPPNRPDFTFVVPRETVAIVNQREPRQVRAARTQAERSDTCVLLMHHKVPGSRKLKRARMVRYHTHLPVDDDNIASALKGIRDEIAAWFGIDDSARSGVEWVPDQEKVARDSLINGHVRVELTLAPEGE